MLQTIMPVVMTFLTAPITSKSSNVGFRYYGDIQPTGFFDPLNLEKNNDVKYLREAELQHGRAAMMASVMIPAYEYMNPGSLGINMLSSESFQDQLPFWYLTAILEFYRMYTGWDNPFVGKNSSYFSLTDSYQPGNLFKIDPDKV